MYIILVYTGTSFQTGPPQIRHKSQLLSIRFSLSLYPQQSAVLPETLSEWRKKLLRPRSSRLRTIVPTRKYVLSSLSLFVPFSFRRLAKGWRRFTVYTFIADNFVRLASPATVSKSNDHFILRIYHTGRRGGEQVRRSLIAAIFPAIVPSSPFPSLDRKPLNPVDRSNRERGRVIFASTCCNFTKFHHRISRFICILPSFFSWILISFYFVNSSFLFFFEEEEKRKREFRKFDESWCKIDIQWFCVFRFLPFSPLIIDF